VTAIIEKEVATRISLGSSAGITPEQIKKIIAEEVEKNMPADVATISQVDGLVSVKIDDYDRERRLNAPTSTAVAVPETDYISDIFIKGSALVVGSKLIYTVIFCVSGANPTGAMATMAITAGQMYLLRAVMSPQADREIKRFKNVAYEKIVGPQPSTWQETMLNVATIGSAIGLTVITFIVSNKIEGHWKAKAVALAAAGASALRMKKAAEAVEGKEEEDAEDALSQIHAEQLQQINAAEALVRSLGESVNLGERIDMITAERLIRRGEQILKIGPRWCFRNTPPEVLTSLPTSPLVTIVNGRPAAPLATPAPRPQWRGVEGTLPRDVNLRDIPSMNDWSAEQVIEKFTTEHWGAPAPSEISATQSLESQVKDIRAGDVYLRVGRTYFRNPSELILSRVIDNPNCRLVRIPLDAQLPNPRPVIPPPPSLSSIKSWSRLTLEEEFFRNKWGTYHKITFGKPVDQQIEVHRGDVCVHIGDHDVFLNPPEDIVARLEIDENPHVRVERFVR
jgi:hypothetical protein